MPDLNSLPPSQNPSNRSSPVSQHRPSPSPAPVSRSPSNITTSTTIPAGVPSGSPRLPRSPNIERRRSSLLRDFNFNESHASSGSRNGSPPTSAAQLPQPLFQYHGSHQRNPSLGELHQELENEQEAQVNRLLAMIRQQQAQIQQLQSQSSPQTQSQPRADSNLANTPSNIASDISATASSTAIASSTPGSSRPPSTVPSRSQSQAQAGTHQSHGSQSQQSQVTQPRTSSSLSRESSYRRPRTGSQSQPSHSSSPSMRAHENTPDWAVGHYGLVNRDRDRDELAFYQTETAMVQRENQMLKGRIRELERQIQELGLPSARDEQPSQAHTSED